MKINEMDIPNLRIGIVGFGEVGQVFARGLLKKTPHVWIYDILLEKGENRIANMIAQLGAQAVTSIEQMGLQCDIIFSLVNSSASEAVAINIARSIGDQTVFLDLTTSTPQVKARSEQAIGSKGGVYIDGAIMGTVATEQFRVPLLIAGENSRKMQPVLESLGFTCRAISEPNGSASGIKLLRSIFMKGLEALILETMITAEKYGVAEHVMQTVSTTMNNNDFTKFANALITTHVLHRKRRYKEILDSCHLIREAQLTPYVTEGVVSFFSRSVKLDELNNNLSDPIEIQQVLHQFICLEEGDAILHE